MAQSQQQATPQQQKLPTPSTSHLNFATIYEPAEDSFLFLDTLSNTAESAFLHSRFHKDTDTTRCSQQQALVVVEVGTGSGVILAFATAHAGRIFGRQDVLTLGIDVNGIVQADLASVLRRGCVDVLLFNPPYVPTESVPVAEYANEQMAGFERESQLLALSYAGGEDGMEVTERLLAEVPEVLSARGVAYVLFCARNKAGESLMRVMAGEKWRAKTEAEEQWEWAAEVVGRTGGKGGWERLEIWRIWRRFSS
ncbi:hypothetical protein DV736_g3268, partial [Chaetothyriales sp. CBS 134916]